MMEDQGPNGYCLNWDFLSGLMHDDHEWNTQNLPRCHSYMADDSLKMSTVGFFLAAYVRTPIASADVAATGRDDIMK